MELSHIDENGRAKMVDVGKKANTLREAVAVATVTMREDTLALILCGGLPKGDVLATARIAGVMAAKRAWELIPMCHPIPLDFAGVEFEPEQPDKLHITATARCTYHTGVEMEAMCAASTAALTVYDMAKGVDRSMVIDDVMLIKKSGGKSGTYIREL